MQRTMLRLLFMFKRQYKRKNQLKLYNIKSFNGSKNTKVMNPPPHTVGKTLSETKVYTKQIVHGVW